MRDIFTKITFWVLSVLLIGYISYTYIPATVQQLAVDEVTLREISAQTDAHYIYLGDTQPVEISVLPENAICAIHYKSSDNSVAIVDDSGVIKAVGCGEADITVFDPLGVEASVPVEIINKPVPADSDLPELYYEKLLIANDDNSLGEDYAPELLDVPSKYPQNSYYSVMRLTPETLEAYEAMFADAKRATGQSIYLNSSYRSYQRQVELYNEDVASYMAKGYSLERARELTEQSTQVPGHSEHQLGESVDISLSGSLSEFRRSRLCKWVTEHAHEYGFILRYPADKVEKTGIEHEWWHFRYVGKGHAEYIYKHGLCLEEYVELQAFTATAMQKYSEGMTADEYMAWLAEQEK